LDRSLRMLRRSQGRSRFTGVVGEACRLPLRDGAIPLVLAVGLTEYLPDKGTFLGEVKRVLRSGGYFLVTISQPGVLNFLRNLLGNRIYPVRAKQWEVIVERKGFNCLGQGKTFLQIQYLFRETKDG